MLLSALTRSKIPSPKFPVRGAIGPMNAALGISLGLLLSFSSPLMAQDQPIRIDHFGGLDDSDPTVALPNSSAQSALNVESSLLGDAIKKRPGYVNVASLTVGTSPVTGSFYFIDTSGNQQTVVCQDHNCATSTNGAAFSVFLSTAGGSCMPTRWV